MGEILEARIQGRFWIKRGDSHLLGRGRVELLEKIRDTGSISQAAKSMKMSYKAAWDSIDALNQVAAEPVLLRVSGGKAGGGSQLTAYGLKLIGAFRALEKEHAHALDQLQQRWRILLEQDDVA